VKENNEQLTDEQKTEAMTRICYYVAIQGLPLPQVFTTQLPYHVEATTSLWPFEAKVKWEPEVDGEYSPEKWDAKRNIWLKQWISDIVKKATVRQINHPPVTISKEWDSYLTVVLDCPEDHWRIKYAVHREAVCERRVVGKKQVEERVIPAREEEVVEWVCNDKSLLDD
jgi:hypothetical protein